MGGDTRRGHYHTVVPGECLASLAQRYGLADASALYDHPENEDLREARSSPHVLAPGDRVFIPAGGEGQRCEPRTTNRFTARRPRAWLRVELHRSADEPLSGVRYELRAEGETFQGTTGGDGLVEHRVDARAQHAELSLFGDDGEEPTRRVRLRVGYLDPPNTRTGARSRLRNLGFGADEEGIRAFQRSAGIEESGEIDPATEAKLRELYKA